MSIRPGAVRIEGEQPARRRRRRDGTEDHQPEGETPSPKALEPVMRDRRTMLDGLKKLLASYCPL
jgi:hypothetical protein